MISEELADYKGQLYYRRLQGPAPRPVRSIATCSLPSRATLAVALEGRLKFTLMEAIPCGQPWGMERGPGCNLPYVGANR